MHHQRVLITVKTYPELSKSYGETVCTAGLRPDGTWIRIYPVPFRRLDQEEQYRKYDWVECGFERHKKDPRPESHCPTDVKAVKPVDHMGTEDNWRLRRELVLQKTRVYTHLDELIDGAKANILSLAVFKPAKILDFVWEETDREWDSDKVEEMRLKTTQGELFPEDEWRRTFELVRKVPYSFSYRFEDVSGRVSKLQILDWEVGMLYWNCVKNNHGDEHAALRQMRAKYYDEFLKKDTHFFLGTTKAWHFRAPNPWVIIGVFPIPHESQMSLPLGETNTQQPL